MTHEIFAALGATLVLLGLMLCLRPHWMDWMNDQINLRTLNWWTDLSGSDTRLRKYERDRPAFRKLFPAALVLLGFLWVIWGFS